VNLRNWANELRSVVGLSSDDAPPPAKRRPEPRRDFIGRDVPIRSRRIQSVLHLKDISCHGAAGISDTPFAVGDTVFIQVAKPRYHAAEVRWVRNFMIGLQFYRPLEPELIEKLHARHCASRDAREHEEAAMWSSFALGSGAGAKG
jgi:hypothetical protein